MQNTNIVASNNQENQNVNNQIHEPAQEQVEAITKEQAKEPTYPGADKVIQLEHPVGAGKLTVLAMCKPKAGHLRGLKLLDVIQMDAAAVAELIPRISVNDFTAQHFYQLEPTDLLEVMTEVATFFTKDQLQTV